MLMKRERIIKGNFKKPTGKDAAINGSRHLLFTLESPAPLKGGLARMTTTTPQSDGFKTVNEQKQRLSMPSKIVLQFRNFLYKAFFFFGKMSCFWAYCKTRTGFVKHGFVKLGFVKHGFVKRGFVKRGFVKRGFVKHGFVKHGFVKGGLSFFVKMIALFDCLFVYFCLSLFNLNFLLYIIFILCYRFTLK